MHYPLMRALPLLVLLLIACTPPTATPSEAAQSETVAPMPAPANAPEFQLPLDCGGGACIVQNYADLNPAIGAADDPRCGPLAYDGHDGLDIRVPARAAARGVDVLAPAAGVVAAVRDGEPDGAFLQGGMAAIGDRECGNGVRIDHANGWSSQLCHMRQSSLRVAVGDTVQAGQAIGLVGLSGHTQFNHLHITLRRNDNLVEPLTGTPAGATRCGESVARRDLVGFGARGACVSRRAMVRGGLHRRCA